MGCIHTYMDDASVLSKATRGNSEDVDVVYDGLRGSIVDHVGEED